MTYLMLALVSSASAADCLSKSTVEQITAKFDAAEKAYADFEVDLFASSLDEVAIMLPCFDAPMTPELAARYHRMRGLRLFIERDSARAQQAFAAARAIDPAYEFPTTLIPPTHSIRTQYSAIDVANPAKSPAPTPVEGHLSFDGTQTLDRPTDWPTIVQVYNGGSELQATAYVFPTDPLPAYKAIAPVVSKAVAVRKPVSPKVIFAIGAGAAAVGAGVLYVMAESSEREFFAYDESYTTSDLEAMQANTNGLTYGAIGAGVLALASGAGVVFVGKW